MLFHGEWICRKLSSDSRRQPLTRKGNSFMQGALKKGVKWIELGCWRLLVEWHKHLNKNTDALAAEALLATNPQNTLHGIHRSNTIQPSSRDATKFFPTSLWFCHKRPMIVPSFCRNIFFSKYRHLFI